MRGACVRVSVIAECLCSNHGLCASVLVHTRLCSFGNALRQVVRA